MINAPGTIIDRTLDNTERDELEQLIDRTSLAAVLDGLAQICSEKAEHVSTNWQDKQLYAAWDAMAGHVLKAEWHARKTLP